MQRYDVISLIDESGPQRHRSTSPTLSIGMPVLHYWFDLQQSVAMLALESQEVIGLRLAKLGSGGAAAATEGRLMFSEKAAAATEAVVTMAAGGTPQSIIGAYREKVRANRLRLSPV